MQAIGSRMLGLGAVIAVMAVLGQPAAAQDKVKVGVFPTASSVPVFRGDRARVLQGAGHRAGDDPADRRSAEHRGDDQQSDRGGDRPGDDRGDERQHQEAGRRHVYRRAQPEQDLPDGAVRGPQGLRGRVDQGSQGRAHHVGARAGQRGGRESRSRQGRPQRARLHDRPARHGPARQCHDLRNLRCRLHARAASLDHAQARRCSDARGRRHHQVHPRR